MPRQERRGWQGTGMMNVIGDPFFLLDTPAPRQGRVVKQYAAIIFDRILHRIVERPREDG